MIRPLALTLSLLLASAAPVLAGTAVELRGQPVSHGDTVTLGDVFDGVDGPAAATPLAHAAQPGLDTVLDAETAQRTARRLGFEWANATGYHRIIVNSLAGDPPSGPARASGRARTAGAKHSRANQALIYARNISSGDILGADDLEWSSDAVAPSDGIADPEAAIGKSARHALRAGAAAAVHDLVSPKVIKRDDLIAVVFEDEGISLTLQGKAMADASVGDTLAVINSQSKKVLEAVCVAPGQAVVGPRADEIKTQSYQPHGQARLVASLH
jgi:flagella basal body P-ring formation protein FlgA